MSDTDSSESILRMRKIFNRARELSEGPERESYLNEACGSDPRLRKQVESYLSAGPVEEGFLESDFVSEAMGGPKDLIGTSIGRYRILDKLGEGGFGEVFRVEQTEPIRRELALKLIKPGMDSQEIIARFESERQALALLDHPNIAQIHDAGSTEDGHPYFVMELAIGLPITQYCDHHRLSIDDRLRLFKQVCAAIQHAHQKAIIHRDLKPSNIVVIEQDGVPMPKIIDFGIAKSLQGHLTGQTMLTQRQLFIGTPAYMSPEQLTLRSSELDTHTDIYSLGAVLYELMAGVTPFDGETLSQAPLPEVHRLLCDEEAPKPSTRVHALTDDSVQIAKYRATESTTLERKLRGDLDWIVMKCLEKDRSRRYDTAKALAQDLEAYLENRPVSAAAPSLIYRTGKYIQRKQLSKVLWGAVPALLFGMLAMFFYFRPGIDSVPDKSIAVLPFDDRSPDLKHAFFAEGIHEAILTNLGNIEDLLVIGRTSVRQYRNTDKTLKQIGEELDVSHLLEGSVEREENRAAITVVLNNARTEGQVWTETYVRTLDDIFQVRATIAKEVAEQLKFILSPEEIEKIEYRPTENKEAFDYYAQARLLIEIGNRPIVETLSLLEESVALDKEFAEAWALLAYQRISYWNIRPNDTDLLAKAHEALEEAERLSPNLADVLNAKARFKDLEEQDSEVAIRILLQALEIDPDHWLSQFNLARQRRRLGNLSEEQHHLETMLQADPFSGRVNGLLVGNYRNSRLWDKAHVLIQKNLERGDRDRNWRRRQFQAEFLQTGDKQAFIDALKTIPEDVNRPFEKWNLSLLSRDYDGALQSLPEVRSSPVGLGFIAGYGTTNLRIPSLELARALIFFAQSDQEQWLIEAGKAKTDLEKRFDHPNAGPERLAYRAICSALEGDPAGMEYLLTEVREKTEKSYWKFTTQTMCEVYIAMAYVVLGEHDKAIETLEAAIEMDSPIFLNPELDLWFIFDRLRGNPRFEALLEE